MQIALDPKQIDDLAKKTAVYLAGLMHPRGEQAYKNLTVAQFAKRLGVSRHTVYQWLQDGDINAAQLEPKILISETELSKKNPRIK
ncbi:MAG: helix-turn-helix domain-containing protein [Puniceicoccaceae bacterium]